MQQKEGEKSKRFKACCLNRPDGSTPLHYACAAGHEKVAQVLLKAGAHADTKNSTGSTPLHNAART